jgi:hypothetical protein
LVSLAPAASLLPAGMHTASILFTNTSSGLGGTTQTLNLAIFANPSLSLQAGASNELNFTVVGMPNSACELQASSNLLNWTTIWTNNIGPTGVLLFQQPDPAEPKNFFRLRTSPSSP